MRYDTQPPVYFEGLNGGPCFYDEVAFREPRKGEYYLSGAIVAAYKAPNDISSKYRIVVPTFKAKQGWVKGEAI